MVKPKRGGFGFRDLVVLLALLGAAGIAITMTYRREALEERNHQDGTHGGSVRVDEVIKAPPGFKREQILFRILGIGSCPVEPYEGDLADLTDGAQYVFFLSRPAGPYDVDSWRVVDSVHILPVKNGQVHPNRRINVWRVDSVREPMDIRDFRRQVGSHVNSSKGPGLLGWDGPT